MHSLVRDAGTGGWISAHWAPCSPGVPGESCLGRWTSLGSCLTPWAPEQPWAAVYGCVTAQRSSKDTPGEGLRFDAVPVICCSPACVGCPRSLPAPLITIFQPAGLLDLIQLWKPWCLGTVLSPEIVLSKMIFLLTMTVSLQHFLSSALGKLTSGVKEVKITWGHPSPADTHLQSLIRSHIFTFLENRADHNLTVWGHH